jgi:hypothetical protein
MPLWVDFITLMFSDIPCDCLTAHNLFHLNMQEVVSNPLYPTLVELWKLRDAISACVTIEDVAKILILTHRSSEKYPAHYPANHLKTQYYTRIDKSIIAAMVVLYEQILKTAEVRMKYYVSVKSKQETIFREGMHQYTVKVKSMKPVDGCDMLTLTYVVMKRSESDTTDVNEASKAIEAPHDADAEKEDNVIFNDTSSQSSAFSAIRRRSKKVSKAKNLRRLNSKPKISRQNYPEKVQKYLRGWLDSHVYNSNEA